MENVPEFMTGAAAPNPGRRHPRILVSPPDMTPDQWAWVLDTDHDLYVTEVTDQNGDLVTRWVGTQDWTYGAEDYLTTRPCGADRRTHTVTVWATHEPTPTDTIRWSRELQADMDEFRAHEAQKHADRAARAARASRQEATNPTPEPVTPTEEHLADWERALLAN